VGEVVVDWVDDLEGNYYRHRHHHRRRRQVIPLVSYYSLFNI